MRSNAGRGATRAGLVLVLAAVVGLPWAFGGTFLATYRLAAVLVVAGAALAVWKHGPDGVGLDRSSRWIWPAAGLVVLAAIQAVPLPRSWLSAVSPAAGAAWERSERAGDGRFDLERVRKTALEAVPEAVSVPEADDSLRPLKVPSPPPLRSGVTMSLQPSATIERLGWFVALLAGFLFVRKAAGSPLRAARIEGALLALFVALAGFGLLQRALAPGLLYGMARPLRGGSVFGPYVNPSHFAWVMELAVPWLLGSGLEAWMRRPPGAFRGPAFLRLGGAALCAVASLVAASKAAFVLVPLAVAVVVWRGVPARRRAAAAAAIAAVGAVLMSVAWFAGPLGERLRFFASTAALEPGQFDRGRVWGPAAAMIRDFPWVGVGFGAFRNAIPPYLPPGDLEPWLQLHNDWLEVGVEGGVVASVLVLVLSVSFWRRAVAGARGASQPAIGRLGLLVGLGAVQLHAFVDFGHQIPANALLFAVASALAVPCAVDWSRAGVSRTARVVALAVTAIFTIRAVEGLRAGPSFALGMRAAARGDYSSAATLLPKGAVGFDRFEARWMEGGVRLGVWDAMDATIRVSEPGLAALDAAVDRFLRSGAEVASSPWPLDGLASTFARREAAASAGRVVDLSAFGGDPWRRVGPAGRIAVGLRRLAIERDPSSFRFRDALAQTFLELGLREAARDAIRAAGRLQPSLVAHETLRPDDMDLDLVEAFAEGAREGVGKLPMMPFDQQLVAIGKVEFRLGRHAEAERRFREAEGTPAGAVSRAEATYWRGLCLQRLGRVGEARRCFEAAGEVANFRVGAAVALAGLARDDGNAAEVLRWLDVARREAPSDTGIVVDFARVASEAGAFREGISALRTALRSRPSSVELRTVLIELLAASGNRPAARRELDVLERTGGSEETVDRLRALVDSAPPSAGSPDGTP